MSYATKSFDEISGALCTGDIILFHGGGDVSRIVEIVEKSEWSHVGMAVRPAVIGLEADCGSKPLLWHSTPQLKGIIDVETKEERPAGPEIVYIEDILHLLKGYGYSVAARSLAASRKRDMMEKLRQFMETVHGDGFPSIPGLVIEYIEGTFRAVIKNLFRRKQKNDVALQAEDSVESMLRAFMEKKKESLCLNLADACGQVKILPDSLIYQWLAEFKDQSDAMNLEAADSGKDMETLLSKKFNTHFCSELVAETYMHMGLLPDNTIPRSFSPKTFSSKGDSALRKHLKLENEVIIGF
jgi:hypothetical protein